MIGKTVLITGASRGIGAAIAEAFACEGYSLIITCKEQENLLFSLQKKLQTLYSIPCTAFVGDMGDFETVRKLFSSISSLDIVINNAGISYAGLLHEMEPDEWDHILRTNLTSVFYCCKFAIPFMLKKHSGKIVQISSVWGTHGASMEAAYSASKGGLHSLTKALANELAPSNIQVNAIACGLIDTHMNACYSKEELNDLISQIPANRMGKPSDVAHLTLSLASATNYLTGQIITLDGGWM